MAKKKEAVPGRVVVLSTVLVIMVVLATLVSLDVGVQSGWKIPGIGSVGFGTGSNSTGSGTVTTTGTSGSNYVTCTQTSCPPNSILPSGQVEFNMKLLAVYTDTPTHPLLINRAYRTWLRSVSTGNRSTTLTLKHSWAMSVAYPYHPDPQLHML